MPSTRGWRALSEDVQHWVFWLSSAGVVAVSLAAGTYLGYFAYFYEGMPLSVVITEVIAASALMSIVLIALLIIGHNYIGWPRFHPLRQRLMMSDPVVGVGKEGGTNPAEVQQLQESIVTMLEWRDPDQTDSRPEYRGWTHVIFVLDGRKKQPARAYVEFTNVNRGTTDRIPVHISDSNWHVRNLTNLIPGSQYGVWVFLDLNKSVQLTIDGADWVGKKPWLEAGAYLTDHAFMTRLHRQRLATGVYRATVVLSIGDVEAAYEHRTTTREFVVRPEPTKAAVPRKPLPPPLYTESAGGKSPP